uniref:Uncharacterized protein n=1 Tax=Daucus carota subsp. sativus TaxID=79200 RepID=A0A166GVR5_DAUCS
MEMAKPRDVMPARREQQTSISCVGSSEIFKRPNQCYANHNPYLLDWKGFVKSRLMKLTLKIERAHEKLQCHPCTNAYTDESISPARHCAFFMGLKRKKEETTEEVHMQTNEEVNVLATGAQFADEVEMQMAEAVSDMETEILDAVGTGYFKRLH